jgi:hypothetical protein
VVDERWRLDKLQTSAVGDVFSGRRTLEIRQITNNFSKKRDPFGSGI